MDKVTAKMEGADTVDVSWLHHSQRDNLVRTKSASSSVSAKSDAPSGIPSTQPNPKSSPKEETKSEHSQNPAPKPPSVPIRRTSNSKKEAKVPPRPDDAATRESPPSIPIAAKTSNARSNGSRRNSWISNLSSKFSTGTTPPSQSHIKDAGHSSKPHSQPRTAELMNPFGAAYSPKDSEKDGQSSPFGSSPKNSSFFHNAFRKLASSGSALGRTAPSGGICERRVLNIDHDRDRCKIPELNQAKLRRVAFCVDVEIAGVSRRDSDDESKSKPGKPQTNGADQKTSPKQDLKASEKAEGTALKTAHHPPSPGPAKDPTEPPSEIADKTPAKDMTRKQEKKKKSEEERKERKEKKRRLAEENGSVPLQVDMSDQKTGAHRFQRVHDQPTIDPVRIYRRCCQLRETGVLKKIVEQISSPSSALAESPGTVGVLDLTGFVMPFQDIVTFGDWLAIVPVRKLILQNCGLTDESVRVILAGLLATRPVGAANSKRGKSTGVSSLHEKFGTIEKLSMKNNPKIGPEGWRHISLFIHMSRSLKGIDLSGIPFPSPPPPTNSPTLVTKHASQTIDVATIFSSALSERLAGSRLEELVLSECYPSTDALRSICNAAKNISLRRFGLANNDMDREGLEHVIEYFNAGHCEGLDLGGNDLNDHIELLIPAFQKTFPLTAMSLAECSLTPKTLCHLLQALLVLPNFRFIDLSHNRQLFTAQPDALAVLRRYLPKFPELRRIHLADVDLTSEKAIALAEILPECPKLCHISVLENPVIRDLAAAKDATTQEEACALYASFMAAVRVSKTLIAVDIDVPTADNNEIVRALASQMVAYCLRNLERCELAEQLSDPVESQTSDRDMVPIPDVLAHLVGPADNEEDSHAVVDEMLAPDEDYVIGGTGVVKALGVCLGNKDYGAVEGAGEASPPHSGTSTPLRRLSHVPVNKKPRDMAKNLLNAARRIRVRLQPALVREDKAGNDLNYRRLQFLDGTLQRMIQRFEDEFPETRLAGASDSATDANSALECSIQSFEQTDRNSDIDETIGPDQSPDNGPSDQDFDRYAVRLSRTSSNTSLHSRALTSEEGRVLRLGHRLGHDALQSEQDVPDEHGDGTISQSPDLSELRKKLEILRPSEEGKDLSGAGSSNIEDLIELQKHDPNAFAEFKESQIVALINAGLRTPGE